MGKIKGHRKAAVKKSREVMLGHLSEQMAPLLPQFSYNYKDAMFL
jgi:predicted Holliday junction resolvase-like endonuclease